MTKNLSNATYGVIDYISYPLGMLVAAPIVLRQIGSAEYGLWMVSTAIVSAGGIIASGFCDAAIQRTAKFRGTAQIRPIARTVRSLLAINFSLGFVVALVIWILAPAAARHLAISPLISVRECIVCVRIAAVLTLVRAIEAVAVSIQRAFEDYRGTVQISTAVRLLTLGFAAILVSLYGGRTPSIMIATAALLTAGTILQFRNLRRFVSAPAWPAFISRETRTLLRSGLFLWIQAFGSVLFRQFDRILLGVSLGAAAVASYSLSIQLAEPLFGLTASGLSFFFPYLSARSSSLSAPALRSTVFKALLCNLLMVGAGAGVLLLFGNRLLQLWAGRSVAHSAASILPLIIVGAALSGLSVTGVYAAQALGLFRVTACINLGSRAALLLLMFYLLRHGGVHGLAVARLLYGAAALLVYLPLLRRLSPPMMATNATTSLTLGPEIQRGVQP
jgi:O-antigen/teichoic acid export membrane protein